MKGGDNKKKYEIEINYLGASSRGMKFLQETMLRRKRRGIKPTGGIKLIQRDGRSYLLLRVKE